MQKNGEDIATLQLPRANIEVKNFSVDKIEKTKKGFKLLINWGGGNYLYSRELYFKYVEGKFYLNQIRVNNYNLKSQKEENRKFKVTPPIRINEVVISEFIDNV